MPRSESESASAALLAIAIVATSAACAPAKGPRRDVLAEGSPHPLVGQKAPPFATTAIDGAEMSLRPSGEAGAREPHVTVVHFFATWAESSKQTLPKLEQIWAKYHAGGLVVLAVSVDDVAAPLPDFVRTYGVKYPVAWDGAKSIVRQWLAREVPATFIVDAGGVVRAAFAGYDDGFESEVEIDVRILGSERDGDRRAQSRAHTRTLISALTRM